MTAEAGRGVPDAQRHHAKEPTVAIPLGAKPPGRSPFPCPDLFSPCLWGTAKPQKAQPRAQTPPVPDPVDGTAPPARPRLTPGMKQSRTTATRASSEQPPPRPDALPYLPLSRHPFALKRSNFGSAGCTQSAEHLKYMTLTQSAVVSLPA